MCEAYGAERSSLCGSAGVVALLSLAQKRRTAREKRMTAQSVRSELFDTRFCLFFINSPDRGCLKSIVMLNKQNCHAELDSASTLI